MILLNNIIFYILFTIHIVSSNHAKEPKKNIHGKKAVLDHPHVAFIRMQEGQVFIFCTGSLIKFDWVLTAAHCICKRQSRETVELNQVVVKVGAVDNSDPGLTNQPLRLIAHDYYNPNKELHDIGLINTPYFDLYQLDVFKALPHIDTLLLAKEEDPIPFGKTCDICGWVKNGSNKTQSFLQCGPTEIETRDTCWKSYSPSYTVHKDMVCVGQSGPACGGDSGGPLLRHGKLYGITIGGWDCTKYPTLILLIGPYRNWIGKKINSDE